AEDGSPDEVEGVERPDLRMRERCVDNESDRNEREAAFGEEQHRAPVDRVRDRAADDRRDEERNERGQVEQPYLERRMGQVVELDRQSDPGDLAEEPRDRLADVQLPERPRLP